MFFNKTAKISPSSQAIKEMELGREDIKRRMEVLTDLSTKLGDAVALTKDLATTLSDRVNKEMKVAKKTLTSFSSKINDGLVMIDSQGKIVHINKVGSKIFDIAEKDAVGKYLSEIVSCANPIYDPADKLIEKPIMQTQFFTDLSSKIFERLEQNDPAQKYVICNDCLHEELPFCFETEDEAVLGVKVIREDKTITLNVTLSVLDNDPESLQDVTYIFLFNQGTVQSHK